MKKLGFRLRIERQRLGYNQATIAAIGGVRANAQGAYERGTRIPRADYLAKLSAVGVDIPYLLTGERNGRPADLPGLPAETSSPSLASQLRADYSIDEAAGKELVEQLRSSIWATASAIAEISRLMDSGDDRSAKDHIAQCLDRLNAPPDDLRTLTLTRPVAGPKTN
ncbi:helix-turn-helix domain-containing protein [Pseudomonas sp. NPDC087358]|uniref:helix-turn-helix domain-containing protein n=1 Tax=Pseudomonas sp. NPDC087358 TaxID=3364439 RepID=UPI00384A5DFB